jgi:hypothetical protein
LKALLWNHIERVIEDEPMINEQFEGSANHSQIVNIHFGMSSFGKFKILLDTFKDMQE